MRFLLWLLDRRTARLERKVDALLDHLLNDDESEAGMKRMRETLGAARRNLTHAIAAQTPPDTLR